jgi:hypothetical protein
MQNNDFMPLADHFSALIKTLKKDDKLLYAKATHTRPETAYRGRHFIIYTMNEGQPVEMDRLIVKDYIVDDKDGASTKIHSVAKDQDLIVGYRPTKLFNYPVFMWLPLHSVVKWSTSRGQEHTGSLGFPVVIRTMSRLGLREPYITYCETGFDFGREFNSSRNAA